MHLQPDILIKKKKKILIFYLYSDLFIQTVSVSATQIVKLLLIFHNLFTYEGAHIIADLKL